MDSDSFTVTFITPALLSGAEPGKVDKIGLRGTSLRGVWRFWARAVWRGIKPDLEREVLRNIENNLFGFTGHQTFRIKIENISAGSFVDRDIRVPTKKRDFLAEAIKPDSSFKVRIFWPPEWQEIEKKGLAGAVAIWGGLGSIGKRARRGFGSVLVQNGTGVFNFKEKFKLKYEFETRDDVTNYIKNNIEGGVGGLLDFIKSTSNINKLQNNLNSTVDNMTFPDMFTLFSLDQIFVWEGDKYFQLTASKKEDTILYKTHGIRIISEQQEREIKGALKRLSRDLRNLKRTDNPNYQKIHSIEEQIKEKESILKRQRDERGDAARLASPIYLRVYKTKKGYIPVATISYRIERAALSQNFNRWMIELGLKKSLLAK